MGSVPTFDSSVLPAAKTGGRARLISAATVRLINGVREVFMAEEGFSEFRFGSGIVLLEGGVSPLISSWQKTAVDECRD